MALYLYRDASIQRKLTFVVLCTSLLGLSLACTAFEIYERVSFRAAMTSELSVLAETLGANTTASLVFNDPKSAQDMLGALRAEHHIVAACLFDASGNLFAEYRRAGVDARFKMPAPRADGERFASDFLTLYRRGSLDGRN